MGRSVRITGRTSMLLMRWICGLSFIAVFVSNVFGGPLDWKISLQSGVDQYHLGHFAAAEDLLQAAVAGSREQGNVTQTADALNYLGDVYLSRSEEHTS